MLIKSQIGYNTTYYNLENIQEMRIEEGNMELINFNIVPAYYVTIKSDGHVYPMARFLERQDAEDELSEFVESWSNDEDFVFSEDDKLSERTEELKKEYEKDARQELQDMQERMRKNVKKIEDMRRTERKIKKIFCCILIFVIYGVVIHIGTGLIKNPVMLAAVSIVTGAIGAAIAGATKDDGC